MSTDDKIKISATLPKGALNGLDEELAEELADLRVEGAHIAPRAMVIVYDVKKVEIDDEGARVVHLRLRRVQPVTFPDGRKAVAQVLHDEWAARNGETLPFELADLSKQTFADLGESVDEQDQREERERETMYPVDELRRHLERVHAVEDAEAMTEMEAQVRHKSDHEPDVLPIGLQHDEDDLFWTRADIEARTAVEDDTDPDGEEQDDGGTPGRQSDADNDEHDGLPLHMLDDGDGSNVVPVEFSGRG